MMRVLSLSMRSGTRTACCGRGDSCPSKLSASLVWSLPTLSCVLAGRAGVYQLAFPTLVILPTLSEVPANTDYSSSVLSVDSVEGVGGVPNVPTSSSCTCHKNFYPNRH